jgi:AcrR family transcriptional regulator
VSDAVNPRQYRSPLRARRAQETRAAILGAAEQLFVTGGYARTRLADVAGHAGVSLATVKLIFGTKADLLLSLWHKTLAGVDDQVPVADRAWYRTIFEVADPAEMLHRLARTTVMIRKRIAPLAQVIEAAAAVDDEIARLQTKMAGEYYQNQRRIVANLAERGHLREGLTVDQATDILWTLNSGQIYTMLVQTRGWTPDQFTDWLTTALVRELLP